MGLHLLAAGWRVIVYCQIDGSGDISYDEWNGLERVNVPVDLTGWRDTSLFDLKCVRHAASSTTCAWCSATTPVSSTPGSGSSASRW